MKNITTYPKTAPFGALALTVALSACSSSNDSTAPGCALELTGHVDASSSLAPGCATLSRSGDGGADAILTAHASSGAMPDLVITADLGPSPTPGSTTSAELASWSAVAVGAGHADCALTAGSDAIPVGDISIDLASVSLGAQGLAGSAHGTIHLTMTVHAPAGTDCGPGDLQNVVLTF